MANQPTPVHDEIAKRAEEIWHERRRPSGCDLEIWLEAERQLATQAQLESHVDSSSETGEQLAAESGESGSTERRLTSETAAESIVEYYISPPISDAEAVKAALQKGGQGSRRRGRGKAD
jgi:hypothetical protein